MGLLATGQITASLEQLILIILEDFSLWMLYLFRSTHWVEPEMAALGYIYIEVLRIVIHIEPTTAVIHERTRCYNR